MKVQAYSPDEREKFEAMLAERDANRTRFEMNHSRNDKDRAERYEREKAKHDNRRKH